MQPCSLEGKSKSRKISRKDGEIEIFSRTGPQLLAARSSLPIEEERNQNSPENRPRFSLPRCGRAESMKIFWDRPICPDVLDGFRVAVKRICFLQASVGFTAGKSLSTLPDWRHAHRHQLAAAWPILVRRNGPFFSRHQHNELMRASSNTGYARFMISSPVSSPQPSNSKSPSSVRTK